MKDLNYEILAFSERYPSLGFTLSFAPADTPKSYTATMCFWRGVGQNPTEALAELTRTVEAHTIAELPALAEDQRWMYYDRVFHPMTNAEVRFAEANGIWPQKKEPEPFCCVSIPGRNIFLFVPEETDIPAFIPAEFVEMCAKALDQSNVHDVQERRLLLLSCFLLGELIKLYAQVPADFDTIAGGEIKSMLFAAEQLGFGMNSFAEHLFSDLPRLKQTIDARYAERGREPK